MSAIFGMKREFAALLIALSLPMAGCGSASSPDVATASKSASKTGSQLDCPATPVWDRRVGPRHEFEMAATPKDAVQEFVSDIGANTVITSIQGGASSNDEVIVSVANEDTAEDGSYRVVRGAGGWSVAGGEGCGAPGPPVVTCPAPSDPPDGTFEVSCIDQRQSPK